MTTLEAYRRFLAQVDTLQAIDPTCQQIEMHGLTMLESLLIADRGLSPYAVSRTAMVVGVLDLCCNHDDLEAAVADYLREHDLTAEPRPDCLEAAIVAVMHEAEQAGEVRQEWRPL